MILGIDPGKNGGVACIDDAGAVAHKIPDTIHDLADLLSQFRGATAYIEVVHSSPQMGVKSAFTFGQGYGHLEMALACHGIRIERVRPLKWQTALGCKSGGDKNITKQKAQELFPALKITHATADALLIAEYGRRVNGRR